MPGQTSGMPSAIDRRPLAGAGRPEEHRVGFRFDEVEGAEMGDDIGADAALMVEVEILEGFAGREPGGVDAGFAAVGLAGRYFSFQAGGQEISCDQASARARSARSLPRPTARGCLSSRHR